MERIETDIDKLKFIQLTKQQFSDIKRLFNLQRINKLSDKYQTIFRISTNKMIILRKTKGHKISNFNGDYLYFMSKNVVDWKKLGIN